MITTMKKIYLTPFTETLEYVTDGLLAVSTVDSDSGIGYGGIDEEGTLDPASRALYPLILLDD